jgi:hypothetical protein
LNIIVRRAAPTTLPCDAADFGRSAAEFSAGAFDNNTRTLSNTGLITQGDLGAVDRLEAIYW